MRECGGLGGKQGMGALAPFPWLASERLKGAEKLKWNQMENVFWNIVMKNVSVANA